ncbi:hypothetical protein HHK36_007892 [Tetracentron sinense]|uniref:Uncharacterized protein n=1 Tax=Tetracentron sinense TaxID=13715 RepID=A0A834ZEM2_TETSI|nr:hypothetical protein HHK36_007892 [Tetracentron sinense]
MLDTYANLVYDYMGGMEDIRKAIVRTVIPASTSFLEDCGEYLIAILRAPATTFAHLDATTVLSRQMAHAHLAYETASSTYEPICHLLSDTIAGLQICRLFD